MSVSGCSSAVILVLAVCWVHGSLAGVVHPLPLPHSHHSQYDTDESLPQRRLQDGQTLAPLPRPASLQYVGAGAAVKLPRHFRVTFSTATLLNCDIFHDALKRFHQVASNQVRTQVSLSNSSSVRVLNSFRVESRSVCVDIPDKKLWPTETANESYKLSVGTDGTVNLSADEVWGLLHGLETVLQLTFTDDFGEMYMPCVEVVDAPRFLHRGFLIDTSRHFLTLATIKEHLDAMAMTKMNVLHWHIVDDQAFPYQSRAFPNMSEKGAFNPYTHVYSQLDVLDVIEYSRRRGIRVIPEFDTPGHTQSWGAGIPFLLTPCYSSGKPDGSFGPIDPSRNSTYTFLQQFMSEQANVFPDNYLHLGGDEVDFDCWKSNPDVNAFMQRMGIAGDYAKLEQLYMNRLIDSIQTSPSILKKMKLLVWQEVFDNKVDIPKDTLVHVWKDKWEEEMARVTQGGFTTLLSSCWYLNYIQYGPDWAHAYTCEPLNFQGTDEQKKLVLGGEACMWGEYMDNTNMIQTTWPRAAAVAERLWSPRNVTDKVDFGNRIDQHRCRMIRRGVRAQPPNGPNYCEW